jgi:hypothetical protein
MPEVAARPGALCHKGCASATRSTPAGSPIGSSECAKAVPPGETRVPPLAGLAQPRDVTVGVGIRAGRGQRPTKLQFALNPSDIPVERATKFETILNIKTAKALGIDLPTSLLLRADEVIE